MEQLTEVCSLGGLVAGDCLKVLTELVYDNKDIVIALLVFRQLLKVYA